MRTCAHIYLFIYTFMRMHIYIYVCMYIHIKKGSACQHVVHMFCVHIYSEKRPRSHATWPNSHLGYAGVKGSDLCHYKFDRPLWPVLRNHICKVRRDCDWELSSVLSFWSVACSKTLRTSWKPLRRARSSGVRPRRVFTLRRAPRSNRAFTIAGLFWETATCNG